MTLLNEGISGLSKNYRGPIVTEFNKPVSRLDLEKAAPRSVSKLDSPIKQTPSCFIPPNSDTFSLAHE